MYEESISQPADDSLPEPTPAPRHPVFNLPHDWVDVHQPLTTFSKRATDDLLATRAGRLIAVAPSKIIDYKYNPPKPGKAVTKTDIRLADANGHILVCSAFTNDRVTLACISAQGERKPLEDFIIIGKLQCLGGLTRIVDPILAPASFRGLIVPVYIKPEFGSQDHIEAHSLILEGIETTSQAIAQHITHNVFAGNSEVIRKAFEYEVDELRANLAWAIYTAHHPNPENPAAALQALSLLAKVNNIAEFANARVTHLDKMSRTHAQPVSTSLTLADLERRFQRKLTPDHKLTGDQKRAIGEILADISRPNAMHRLLSGDTGTGKTAVFGLASIAVAQAGFQAAILAPTETLALQLHKHISEWAPDLPVTLCLSGNDPGPGITVGTSAILSRTQYRPAFIVVDEQHVFSREQRERLRNPDADRNAHLLETSATLIPRSTALSRMRILHTSELSKPFKAKSIQTRIWLRRDCLNMWDRVKKTVDQGGSVLVFFHAKSKNNSLISYISFFETYFKNNFAVAYAAEGPEGRQIAANIEDFRAGRIKILLSTSILERGSDFPNVRHVVVMDCTRFGHSSLHQLRGRAAREGGEALCDLYIPDTKNVTDQRMASLEKFAATTDGLEVAKLDLANRGHGDVSAESDTQHGRSHGIFTGGLTTVADTEWAHATIPLLPEWMLGSIHQNLSDPP